MATYNKFHEIDSDPDTNAHLAEIVSSISRNGWRGLPLLADGYNLLNGCHRAAACELLDIDPEVHQIEIMCKYGDDDYIDYLLGNLAEAKDSDQVLAALKALRAECLVDDLSVAIMQAECDKE